jgi:predicted exporter
MAEMRKKDERVSLWQGIVVGLMCFAFYVLIPARGKPHHWTYSIVGLAIAAVVVFFVLRPGASENA